MLLAKCLALPAGPKQRREGWSNYVECPLPSALLYAWGPTSTVRSSMYSFFFKVMPLATCSWFSAATGSFLCRNEFLPGVLDDIYKLKSIMIYSFFSFEYILKEGFHLLFLTVNSFGFAFKISVQLS